MKVVAMCLLAGLAQAALLSEVHQDSTSQEEDDLMIKMPDAVAHQSIQVKAAQPLALVQSQTTQQLGMFESGVLHASLKPIVKAKVAKVINFIQQTKEEYSHGTEDQKKAIQQHAESLVMAGAGSRSFNLELCELIWSEASDIAVYLSFYYCPNLIFPGQNADQKVPPLEIVQSTSESRLRSAYLSHYFWEFMLSSDKRDLKGMMGKHACYWYSANKMGGTCNHTEVKQTLPYIGWPTNVKTANPIYWNCDESACIVPVEAWAWKGQYCFTEFDHSGKVSEVIIPMNLWR